MELLGDIDCPLPNAEEVVRIATFLDQETAKIDALIEEQRRLIKLLKEKRQAVISHAVTKGLKSSSLKHSGVEWIGSVPDHWEIMKVSDLFIESRTQGIYGLPILSVSIHHGVSDRELKDDLERTVNRSEDHTKYKRVRPGDLTYNMMRAWQGAFGAVLVEGMVSPAYIVARPREEINAKFVERMLRTSSAVKEMKRFSKGVTDFRMRLYWDDFKNIRLPFPPSFERDAILQHLERLDALTKKLVNAAGNNINLLQERRAALISAAVTGKIDVRHSVRKPVASVRPYSSGFAYQVVAAEILARCNDSHMGRTKLQKLIHVTEYHAQIDELRGEYTRQIAGPLDKKAMAGLERGLEKQRWYKTVRDGNRYRYLPLDKHEQHSKYLEHWADKQPRIDEVLTLMGSLTMRQCEIVSTLYAAWNDLLIDNFPVTDDGILAQAATAEGWHESKARTPREKWEAALRWMKDEGLVPTGFGAHTRKVHAEVVHEPA